MKDLNPKAGFNPMALVASLSLVLVALCAPAAQAQTSSDSARVIRPLAGSNVGRGLGDPDGRLFLLIFPAVLDPVTAVLRLNVRTAVVALESNQLIYTQQAYASGTASYLANERPVSYYGATVWPGYVAQPGNQLIRTDLTHSSFNATGVGVTVAEIDTGVDRCEGSYIWA